MVPRIVRNPLYQWTHLELRRVFGVDELLNPDTAREIYSHCTSLLGKKEFSARSIIRKFRVEALCTTDDPSSTLEEHWKIRESGFETIVAPAFRPNRALEGHLPERFNPWLERLAELAEVRIDSFGRFMECLWKRHQFFHDNGCRLSDYGIDTCYASVLSSAQVEESFTLLRSGRALSGEALLRFRSAVLYELSLHWTHPRDGHSSSTLRRHAEQQLPDAGTSRPDTGYDAMGDFEQGRTSSAFLTG